MVRRKYLYDIVKEAALKREGWFFSKDIQEEVNQGLGALGRPGITTLKIGKYMSMLWESGYIERVKSERWVLCAYAYRVKERAEVVLFVDGQKAMVRGM